MVKMIKKNIYIGMMTRVKKRFKIDLTMIGDPPFPPNI